MTFISTPAQPQAAGAFIYLNLSGASAEVCKKVSQKYEFLDDIISAVTVIAMKYKGSIILFLL